MYRLLVRSPYSDHRSCLWLLFTLVLDGRYDRFQGRMSTNHALDVTFTLVCIDGACCCVATRYLRRNVVAQLSTPAWWFDSESPRGKTVGNVTLLSLSGKGMYPQATGSLTASSRCEARSSRDHRTQALGSIHCPVRCSRYHQQQTFSRRR